MIVAHCSIQLLFWSST